jgi:hypothetical protein
MEISYIQIKVAKLFLFSIFQKSSRTTGPEKLKSKWKLPDIVQIQLCKNHGPWDHMGPQ